MIDWGAGADTAGWVVVVFAVAGAVLGAFTGRSLATGGYRIDSDEAGALPRTELHLPHDRLLAIHCGHGQRAATGLSVLEHRGYTNLALIAEGIDQWREAGGDVELGTPSGREPARL
jgi:rhodanese-related sulfurtransferase